MIANPLSLSNPRILAIDPGRSGAVVLFGRNTLEVRRDFKEEYDIVRAVQELAPTATEAVIEFVAAMPGHATLDGPSEMIGTEFGWDIVRTDTTE